MDSMLILFLRKGANLRPVKATTTDIGAEAGMSQQNASRRLMELEAEGYIERRKDGIILTEKAVQELASLHAALRSAFEGGLELKGTIVAGLGEGRFYLSLDGYRKEIRRKLGFEPYPGTLNVRVDPECMPSRQQLRRMEPQIIQGFKGKDRAYGDLFAYNCRIGRLDCALIIPLRTHHGPDIIEVISSFDIKKTLGKKDGDSVKVVV
jgi:riboflavin kinase